MKKVQFGCGANRLDGWENYDAEIDIRNPLPQQNGEVDFIFLEHLLEHITQKEAYRFIGECHRILKPGGVVRIVIPDLKKIYEGSNPDYLAFISQFFSAGTVMTTKQAVENIIFNHNHESYWNAELLVTLLSVFGFRCSIERYRKSRVKELNDIDGHWKLLGLERCIMESIVVEAVKI